MKNANNYSQNEVEIGNWIDGKTLYRKVIPFTIGSTKDQSVVHGVSNVEYVMIEKAILLDANGNYHDISACSQYFELCYASKERVEIRKLGSTYYTGVSAWIVINYTKTL